MLAMYREGSCTDIAQHKSESVNDDVINKIIVITVGIIVVVVDGVVRNVE